ncbi:MAG: helicase RepA family protein [Dissulfurispiraceae bacterium]
MSSKISYELPAALDIKAAFEAAELLDFCLPGLLARTVGSIIGPGGIGKSYLVLQLAVLIACGIDITKIYGRQPTGRVLYLSGEDPLPVLHNRIHALGEYLDIAARADVKNNLQILPLIGQVPCLLDQSLNTDEKWVDLISRSAENCRLLIIDTARRFHLAPENDSAAMNAFLELFEKITHRSNCTILYCHHVSKSSVSGGNGENTTTSRGSSVLVDNIRWMINLSGMSLNEAKALSVSNNERGKYVSLRNTKSNYAASHADIWLKRQENGVLVRVNLTPPREKIQNGREIRNKPYE